MANPLKPQSPGEPAGAAAYSTGYGKPPKASQFMRGQSGNPRGSSKKARTRKVDGSSSPLDQIILREAERKIAITENGVRSKITTHEAVVRKLTIGAAKGDSFAQKRYFDQVQSALERQHAHKMTRFGLLAQYVKEQAVARGGAQTFGAMPILPHPDDVVLDYISCIGEVVGPIDTHQAEPFVALVNDYLIWKARLTWLHALLIPADHGLRRLYEKAIDAVTAFLAKISRYSPPSFRAQLDWDVSDIPIAAMEIADPVGGVIDLTVLSPEHTDTFYALHLIMAWAGAFERDVPRRARLNASSNTICLINRLQVDRQSRAEGMPPPPAAPAFAEFYEGFAAEGRGPAAEAAP